MSYPLVEVGVYLLHKRGVYEGNGQVWGNPSDPDELFLVAEGCIPALRYREQHGWRVVNTWTRSRKGTIELFIEWELDTTDLT